MNPFAPAMKTPITVADITGQTRQGATTYGPQRVLKVAYQAGGKTRLDAAGRVSEVNDVILSGSEITKNMLVWLPGTDTTKATEARRPQVAKTAQTPFGTVKLWRVEL